jgi:hypothetical protein
MLYQKTDGWEERGEELLSDDVASENSTSS